MARAKKPGTVVGVFANRKSADQAARDLRAAGFTDEQIGVASRDRRKSADGETMAEEGAVTGVIAGAGVGTLIGLGVLAGVIPVIGPVIAGGTLAVILANAAGGAAIAGIVGALVGLGVPEEEAEFYENELRAGRTVVTVDAGRKADLARDILQRNGGYNLETAPEERVAAFERSAAARAEADEVRTLQLKEERLHARKTPVKTGEVKVRKNVVTEHRTLEVPVRREEVVVERRSVGGRRATSDLREGEEVRIPVRSERVKVEKEPVVTEEVRVGKRTVTDTERVSGTVRREEARIEREGDAKTCEMPADRPTSRKR
jgi:uncharacterized protein (TIGR02271 family)